MNDTVQSSRAIGTPVSRCIEKTERYHTRTYDRSEGNGTQPIKNAQEGPTKVVSYVAAAAAGHSYDSEYGNNNAAKIGRGVTLARVEPTRPTSASASASVSAAVVATRRPGPSCSTWCYSSSIENNRKSASLRVDNYKSPEKEMCCFGSLKPKNCFKFKPISKPYAKKQIVQKSALTKTPPYPRLTPGISSGFIPIWAHDCVGGTNWYDMEIDIGSTYIKSINRLQKRINNLRLHSLRASVYKTNPIQRGDSS